MGPFSQLLKNRFSIHLRLSAMLICLAAPFTSLGQTTAPALQIFAKDMREEIVRINVTMKDLYNRQETRPMPITIYRPAGDGPFPLVVFNHGRATTDKRAAQGRYRPEHAARYLVAKGFVVFVPTRVGYWETYVDASRWLVAGVSVGGLTTVATVGRNPKGWHKAWVDGGGNADFKSFPPAGEDGHIGLIIDMNSWLPVVDEFLNRLGFSQTAIVSKPAASGFAELGDVSKVPISAQAKTNGYAKFLESKSPRAFAVGERGAWGWASGDYATGKAIGFCQRSGQSCKLYAVDDDVVWRVN